jgi:2-amino-4-hydroxy-6-hydroxymethyldihydropteridine diphosphokinase / dihydropteroate synthase
MQSLKHAEMPNGLQTQTVPKNRRAFVALGSNLGDRFKMIEKACIAIESQGDIRITRTSSLWETKAMYVEDQANFLNGACEVETSLEPMQLLDRLQSIENELGRVKLIDKGPRNIDLDILLYDSNIMVTDRLNVPHKLMLEREFVLRPLCQLIPDDMLPKPMLPRETFQEHLIKLSGRGSNRAAVNNASREMSAQVPLCSSLPALTPSFSRRKTQVMAILNLTPDSFSDGGKHEVKDASYLRNTITDHIESGATILDIGGQSSRPGAVSVSASEELSRILPAITICKEMDIKAAISVDTYRAEVAEKAAHAGAHIINDISAGLLDPRMLSTVARLGCTYILMHMRGAPETMSSKENCTYDGDLIQIIAEELLERVAAAEAAGIRRWRMILDPGIGFAKNQEQNLEILRRFDELRGHPKLEGFPWLIGTSRKNFVGRITGVKEASQRSWGTAGAVTAAVQGGADVVRVHDVNEMAKVVKMADAIWRV